MDIGYSDFYFQASRGRVFSTCFDTSIVTVKKYFLGSLNPLIPDQTCPEPNMVQGGLLHLNLKTISARIRDV